jgi:hypothetical protein
MKRLLLCVWISLCWQFHGFAATIHWDGGGDGRSWSDPLNWSGDRVPGVTDNVVLPAASATNVIYRGTQPSPRSVLNQGTLWINGNGSHAALTVGGSFTNRGTLLMQSSDGGYNETLTVGGTLHNASNGVIQVSPGTGGGRYLYANVVNNGTINVASGIALYCYGAGRTFEQEGGRLSATGLLTWADGWFSFIGGTANGAVYVLNGALDVADTAGASTLFCAGNSTLLGIWAPGVTVWVQGNGTYSHATLTTAEGAVNAGTVRLESANGGYNCTLNIGGTGFVNLDTGVIDVRAGAGGGRSISGYLVNQGLVRATNTSVDLTGGYEVAGGRVEGNVRLRNTEVVVSAAPAAPTTLDL